MLRFVISLITISVVADSAIAQQSYPMLMSIDPVAAQIGSTSEHVLKSRYTMEDAYEVLVAGDGVVGEVVLPAPPKGDEKKLSPLQSLTVRFQVEQNATPGVRDFRIATLNGVSTVGQLTIVQDAVVVETKDNDNIAGATAVALPATICGRIERAEDVDLFKFHADANQTICFHVRCMRLQDRIHDLQQHADPILSIRNGSGSIIASSDNVFAADPFVCQTFTEAGDYYLELRDVRYQGNQYWGYCIEANNRPFVRAVFPLAIGASEKTSLQLIGHALPDDSHGEVSLQSPLEIGIQDVLVTVDADHKQLVSVVVTEGPTAEESDAHNDAIENAQPIAVPSGINGVVEVESDIDCFVFEAKKGERYTFEVFSRRAGSALDPQLRILNEKGSQQQLGDDMRVGKRNYADSCIENWSVPTDGKYIVEVRDVHSRGGELFVYFLNVTRCSPHFTLFADTDKTPLSPGTSGVIFVRTERKNGFDGEIQLQVDGLPEGVTAKCGRILAGTRQDGCIVLTAAADAKPAVSNIRISGVATITEEQNEPREIMADAAVYQETYQPGGGRGHWPVDSHAVSVGKPGDVRNVKLSAHELTLKPGESASIDVEIQRAEGFDKNVILEVNSMHLSTVYGDPLPEGVSIDRSASKVLLTGGATKGKITLKAAANAQLAEKQQFVVMANVSLNFVMKATYASEPVYVTVKK